MYQLLNKTKVTIKLVYFFIVMLMTKILQIMMHNRMQILKVNKMVLAHSKNEKDRKDAQEEYKDEDRSYRLGKILHRMKEKHQRKLSNSGNIRNKHPSSKRDQNESNRLKNMLHRGENKHGRNWRNIFLKLVSGVYLV
jgi:hypothetical protein